MSSQFLGPETVVRGLGCGGSGRRGCRTAERVLRLLGVTEGTTLLIDGGQAGSAPPPRRSRKRAVPQ